MPSDPGRGPTAKYLDQARALRANAPVDQLPILREDRHLAFPLPQVQAHMGHGEPPLAALTALKVGGAPDATTLGDGLPLHAIASWSRAPTCSG